VTKYPEAGCVEKVLGGILYLTRCKLAKVGEGCEWAPVVNMYLTRCKLAKVGEGCEWAPVVNMYLTRCKLAKVGEGCDWAPVVNMYLTRCKLAKVGEGCDWASVVKRTYEARTNSCKGVDGKKLLAFFMILNELKAIQKVISQAVQTSVESMAGNNKFKEVKGCKNMSF
jgi:hypothetical protein